MDAPPALSRRRSSLVSNFSDSRYSFRSSTDNLTRPSARDAAEILTTSTPPDAPTFLTSLPVVLALVPPIIGLTAPNGAGIATDMVILALAAWFLNACVRVPWDWYHEAQQRRYEFIDPSDVANDSMILEENEDSIAGLDESREDAPSGLTSNNGCQPASLFTSAQQDARDQLKRAEMSAFAACFLGPLLGAVLLHTIRGQLTRAEGIVSDFNLGIFVLGAEIRPFDRLNQMRKEKIWHLQRIVRSAPPSEMSGPDAQRISQRIADLEARFDGTNRNSDADVSKIRAQVQQSNQLQLDALNRAVRRYEKKQAAQDFQIDARFHMLEAQLRDALALAAAAARNGQRPSLVANTVAHVVAMVNYGIQTSWTVATYPLRTTAHVIAIIESWFLDDQRQTRRRGKAQINGHTNLTANRMQSKSAR